MLQSSGYSNQHVPTTINTPRKQQAKATYYIDNSNEHILKTIVMNMAQRQQCNIHPKGNCDKHTPNTTMINTLWRKWGQTHLEENNEKHTPRTMIPQPQHQYCQTHPKKETTRKTPQKQQHTTHRNDNSDKHTLKTTTVKTGSDKLLDNNNKLVPKATVINIP